MEREKTKIGRIPTKKYSLDGLHCAQCAAEIEGELMKLEYVGDGRVNFAAGTVSINPEYERQLRESVARIEPGVKVRVMQDEQGPYNQDRYNQGRAKDERIGGAKIRAVPDPELIRLLGAVILFTVGILVRVLPMNFSLLTGTGISVEGLSYLLFGAVYGLTGFRVVKSAVLNIFHGKIFDENFLMTLATIGAAAIGEVPEAAAVMLFYAVGEYFQEKAVRGSRRSIRSLMSLRPEFARLVTDRKQEELDPSEVRTGDIIEIRPGERVPLDGEVISGESFIDTSTLTGESVPKRVRPGKEVLAGSVNSEGILRLRVLREFENSAVMRILQLVEESSLRKAPTEKFITRFAGHYTPAVVMLALAVAFIPPLLTGNAGNMAVVFSKWVYRALLLLVISCPCALVVSIPLGYFAGVGTAARHGILVKGGEYLDRLLEIRSLAFDKTGTLTRGVFSVQRTVPRNGFSRQDLLTKAAIVEEKSNHPIARSIREARDVMVPGDGEARDVDPSGTREKRKTDSVTGFREIRGRGVIGTFGGVEILAGNDSFMHEQGIHHQDCDAEGTIVYVAVDGLYAGYIVIADEMKPDAPAAIRNLKLLGIKKTILLTGDDRHAANKAAEKAGIDEWKAELLPEEKISLVEELESRKDHAPTMFVGDGINDAPVLMRAHIGAAMGGSGSDSAIEAADIVLMKDDLLALPEAVGIARRTRRIVIQNVFLALGVKSVVAIAGIAGVATMWAAVFADVGVALLAILNSMRIMKNPLKPDKKKAGW